MTNRNGERPREPSSALGRVEPYVTDKRTRAYRQRQAQLDADAEYAKATHQRDKIAALADPARNDSPHERSAAQRMLDKRRVPVRREASRFIAKVAQWDLCRGCGEPLPPNGRIDRAVHGKACQKRFERTERKRRYVQATGETFTNKAVERFLTYVDMAQADILAWPYFGTFRPEEQRQLLGAVARTMGRILRTQLDSTDPADVRFARLDKYLNEYVNDLNLNLNTLPITGAVMDISDDTVEFAGVPA